MRSRRTLVRASLLALPLLVPGTPALSAPAPPADGVAFNGHTTRAVIEDGRSFDLPEFSLSAWVKLRSPGDPRVFLNRGGRGKLFTLYLYRGKVRMLVEYAPGAYAHADAPPPPVNTWTHYAGTYDGKEIRVYLDGVRAAGVKAPGRMPASDEPLYLGAEAPQASVLDGWLEDARLWKRALTADEVAQVAAGAEPAQADLLGRWRKSGLAGAAWRNEANPALSAALSEDSRMAVRRDDGYRGIWYSNQPSKDEYVYKYSGGLGTYCAKHSPFAVYAPAVRKTFFCYGGTVEGKRELLHMVSYYDHETGKVPRPTLLLNKRTDDAHDNPVISLDDEGYVWIFSSSHGTARPSYISRSTRPYSVDAFEHVLTTNFSYPQVWHLPGQGFLFVHTRYQGGRCNFQMTSRDGRTWDEGRLLAKIDEGHYQVSGVFGGKAGTAFNFHPKGKGLNWRTNLYYMETPDFGQTWRSVRGEELALPLTTTANPALVHDYQAEGLNVYMKDLVFESQGRPIILFLTSKGYESGPKNAPRTWRTARWTGGEWTIRDVVVSDNNYDMGSLYVEGDSLWRLIAPALPGPQAYNPGGEVGMWTSEDQGASWRLVRQLTQGSEHNHTYVRRPVNAHPDFYAFWADGHARKPSESRLYFCDKSGERVWRLPARMDGDFAAPEPVR